jgi:hypothetical protein
VSDRRRLPNRRRSEIVDFRHEGRRWSAAVSRFDDGRIADVFLNAEKDSAVAHLAQESAIVASIAVQYGAPLASLRHALAGREVGPLAVALGFIEEGDR